MRGVIKRLIFICFVFSVFLTSCASLREQHDFDLTDEFVYIPERFVWQTITDEIQYSVVNFPKSPVIYHVVKIDLNSTNIEIVEYVADKPENKKKAIVIDKFCEKTGATVGFNTSPFNVSNRLALGFTWMPSKYENIGLHIADGEILSPAVEQYCALAFFKETDGSYRAKIFDSQIEVIDADFAFGGFYTILRDGKKRTFPANNYNSRTGAGIADNGKTLYIMIVEGENQKTSLGLSYPACADIFMTLGCDVAMQFDGGGSSGLFINKKNVLTYKPIRKNPSFIGIRIIEN